MELFGRIDVWVIAVYMGAMLLVALYVSSGSRDVEGYTVGGRRMAGWAIGLSVLGTFTSSISFLALPANAYKGNWNAFVFSLALPVAALIAVRWFVPLYRYGVGFSAYELLEYRIGYWARAYADVSYIILQLIRVAMVLLLVALAVSRLIDFPVVSTIIVLGVLVIIYDTLGGIRAVIWTDVGQVVILVAGALWCLISLSYTASVEGHWQHVSAEKFSLGSWNLFDLAAPTVFVTLLYGISENLRNYGTDQNYVQRILAARSDRDAKGSIWLGAIAYLPVSLMFCLIGTALYANFPPDALSEGMKPEEVFPNFIRHGLPPGISGLVIAAIMAAAMSTVDSSLNSMSTVVLIDMVRPLRRGGPRIPEIVTLRLSTVTLGIVGTGLAIVIYRVFQQKSETILDMWWQYAGTAGGGMMGLFLLAWLAPRTPSWISAVGVILSIPVLAWGTFVRELPADAALKGLECPLHPRLVGISGTLVILACGALGVLAVQSGLLRPNPRWRPDA